MDIVDAGGLDLDLDLDVDLDLDLDLELDVLDLGLDLDLDLDLDDIDLCDLEQSRALLMQQGLLFISGPLGATTIRRMPMNGRDSNKGSHFFI